MIRKITKNNVLFLFVIAIETLVAKTIVYGLLPRKYRYDSGKIYNIMNGSGITDKSYSFTADFYKNIDFLKLTNIYEWSFLIGIIGFFIIYMIIKNKQYSKMQKIYIISTVFLLNIYTFVLSKEFIQTLFFLLIQLIIISRIKRNKKNIIILIIFLLEALLFRVYYFIIGSIFFLLSADNFIKKKNTKNKSFVYVAIASVLLLTIEAFVLSKISSENYQSLIEARSSANVGRIGDLDAASIINNILPNSNIFYFFINTIINSIRLLIPIELVTKGFFYIPFILYQIYITTQLVKYLRNAKNEMLIGDERIDTMLIVVISFLVVSAVFEPDFGSFIKHEAALFIFILPISHYNNTVMINRRKSNEFELTM